jgi:predicted dehydrogenase
MHYQRAAWDSLRTGKIGKLGLVRMYQWMSSAVLENSNEAVAEMFVREVDLACWFFDAVPEVVYGTTMSRINPLDGILFHLGFRGGGMAIVDCTHRLGGQESYASLTLIGSNGAVYADDQHNTNLLLLDRTFGHTVRPESDWFGHQLAAFFDSIALGEGTRNCSIEDAVRAVDVANAVIHSFRVGQATSLSGANDEPG